MERETKKIEGHVAYKLACSYYECEGFEEVERNLTGSDQEDGGGEYELIVEEKSTGKFFQMNFCDWDEKDCIYPDGRIDLPTEMREVFPEVITKLIYK